MKPLSIENAWYRRAGWSLLLAPLSGVFWLLSAARRLAYRHQWLKTHYLPVPVLVVGNITVGGSGKTPLVIWLAEQLTRAGIAVGVISRGYGGKAIGYPLLVKEDTPPSQCGDEPLLIHRRSGLPVVVGPDRVAAGTLLLQHFPATQLIISDDGLQHYRLGRQWEVIVIDGQRRFGNGWLLPAGPLREGRWRLQQAQWLVNNGGPARAGEIVMTLVADGWINVRTGERRASLPQAAYYVAMAGIGHPERFFHSLRQQGVALARCHAFADHQAYSADMLKGLVEAEGCLLMTEKDAVKCTDFAQDNWWYLAVSAQLDSRLVKELCQQLETHHDT